jgi:hypothetical protein
MTIACIEIGAVFVEVLARSLCGWKAYQAGDATAAEQGADGLKIRRGVAVETFALV